MAVIASFFRPSRAVPPVVASLLSLVHAAFRGSIPWRPPPIKGLDNDTFSAALGDAPGRPVGRGPAVAADRATQGQTSDSWRQLSNTEFVQEMQRLTSGDPAPTPEQWTEIRAQSAERLLAAIEGDVAADLGDMVSLYLWARPALSAAEQETVRGALRGASDQARHWTFAKLREVQVRMDESGLREDDVHQLTWAWLEQRDVATLQDLDQLGWLFAQIQLMDRREIGRQEFSITWTGSVQAPVDGSYTFSICPLDLNYEHGGTFREQSMRIWVAEQQILDSSAGGWTYQAKPITLTAARPAAIRVELSYACTSQGVIDDRPAIAHLYWEGPGLSRRLVPSSALTPPEGQAEGLRGAYRIGSGEDAQELTRVDPAIDFIWYHQCLLTCPRQAVREPLARQLFAVASDVGTLGAWESGTQGWQENWQGNWAFLESLSSSRQAAWAQTLATHPALLESCNPRAIATLYSRCRVGAPDEALRMVGLWAQLHADETPVPQVDFYQANREVYRELSHKMVSQYAGHLTALEEGYLELPDGTCSLPVAYIVSYGYWAQGKIRDWIDQLDGRLEGDALDGDRRVNWLIARAQAEAIRRSPAHEHWYTNDRYLAGRAWLEEATMVAQSEPVRLRAFWELAVRETAYERVDQALQMLDRANERCTSPASSEAIATWRAQLETLRQALADRHAQREAAAQQAYLEHLRARYQNSLSRGDSAASTRYEQKLSAAGVPIETP
jgi:hypothetical protein